MMQLFQHCILNFIANLASKYHGKNVFNQTFVYSFYVDVLYLAGTCGM